RPANTRPSAGGAGVPLRATGRPPTGNNAAATRRDAIAAAGNSARLTPSHRRHLPKSSPSHPWSRLSHHPRPTRPPHSPRPARASVQTEFRNNPPACPAIGQAATFSSSPRRVPRCSTSVPAPVAGRYDASNSAKPDSGSDAFAGADRNAAVIADHRRWLGSCRHILRIPRSEDYRSVAPKDRGGSGWAGRSGPPVSSLGKGRIL
ncbi:MAG: hypothetical protein QOD14_1112, partial [Solirubrobacterales bacterium]|nr:hypothetical protein [Solirubrobacterales bacterium]